MEGSTVHIVTLNQKPCVVQYLDKFNKFLIGTYELFPSIDDAKLKLVHHHSFMGLDDSELDTTLKKINFRAGKLILMRDNDVSVPGVEYEFDCQAGGGVFDIKVRYNSVDNSYIILVAHSNGTIGIYKLALHCGNKICLREHLKVNGSKMLTCIDTFDESPTTTQSTSPNQKSENPSTFVVDSSSPDKTRQQRTSSFSFNHRLVVGDSEGFVTVILYPRSTDSQSSIRENVADGDSIWQVKSLRLASGKDIVIVGSENSSWSIYSLDDDTKRLILLYKNFKDFTAGVTCISLLDVFHSDEYDLVEILLGSYDETLQAYQIKLNHDGLSKPGVCHMNTISIDNGGIWRVKPMKGNNKRQLCIAAMYAGSYILNLDGESIKQLQSLDNPTALRKIIDTESLKLSQKPLHYDIDVSSCNRTYCIVDFNNSLCLFYKG